MVRPAISSERASKKFYRVDPAAAKFPAARKCTEPMNDADEMLNGDKEGGTS
jgi:hypothetical protein